MNQRARRVIPLLLLFVAACAAPISEAVLAERIALSKPAWQSYQEDVKTQIGAGPIAQWQGEPVRAAHQAQGIQVSFAMQGPWAERDLAVPVLVRDPLGKPHQNTGSSRHGTEVTYTFAVSETDAPFAWIEVKFPNAATRIVLRQDGSWEQAR